MDIVRDFYSEIKEDNFKKITYTIFNKMDDEFYVKFLEQKFDELFSIEDFKYYEFNLSEKESFLIRMHNKEYLKNVKKLKDTFSKVIGVKIYVNYKEGKILIVKLNKIKI